MFDCKYIYFDEEREGPLNKLVILWLNGCTQCQNLCEINQTFGKSYSVSTQGQSDYGLGQVLATYSTKLITFSRKGKFLILIPPRIFKHPSKINKEITPSCGFMVLSLLLQILFEDLIWFFICRISWCRETSIDEFRGSNLAKRLVVQLRIKTNS